jgi:tRNA(Ile)-lysidine synthetase-like protein
LPGFEIERDGSVLTLRRSVGAGKRKTGVLFERVLPIPGGVELPTGWTIMAALETGIQPAALGGYAGDTAAIQASSVTLPLIVRTRRPGDRLRPLGSPGSRKLKDVLIDRKIPRAQRDSVPVVVDAEGRIAWVAGLTIAEHCRVTCPETGVVVLKLGRTGAVQDVYSDERTNESACATRADRGSGFPASERVRGLGTKSPE